MNDADELTRRIRRLEELSAHQDRLLQELNDAILQLRTDAQQHIDRLQRQIAQLESFVDDQSSGPPPLEKPPHY